MEIQEEQHKHYETLFLPEYKIKIFIKLNDYVEYKWDDGKIAKFSTKEIIYELFKKRKGFKINKKIHKNLKSGFMTYIIFKDLVKYCLDWKKRKFYKNDLNDLWYDSEDGPPAVVEKVICNEIIHKEFKHIQFIQYETEKEI